MKNKGRKGKRRSTAKDRKAKRVELAGAKNVESVDSDSSGSLEYVDPPGPSSIAPNASSADEGRVASPMDVDETAQRGLGDDAAMGEKSLPSVTIPQEHMQPPPDNSNNITSSGSISDDPVDLVNIIPGMYRILDLVSEQGSGGLVDKIVISQDSFGRFVNDVRPGAYASMTHVNFDALDSMDIRPIGLYGSKSEIVRYLYDLAFVDDATSQLLLTSKDEVTDAAQKVLRSGLYLIRTTGSDLVYVLYWPQDTTWNDSAITSVARNRETFMRYLTKIADQIIVLVSEEHANGIVWDEGPSAESTKKSSKSGRLFTFQVNKTREQQENVTVSPGFMIQNPSIKVPSPPDDCSVDPQQFAPRLVPGDANVGVLVPIYEPARETTRRINETFSTFRLDQFLSQQSFRLDESLSEDSLMKLCKHGLSRIASEDYEALQSARAESSKQLDASDNEQLEALKTEISAQHDLVIGGLRDEVLGILSERYGAHLVERIREHASSIPTIGSGNASNCLMHLTVMHPRLEKLRGDLLADQKWGNLGIKQFKMRKAILLEAEEALSQQPDLSEEQVNQLVEGITDKVQSKGQPEGIAKKVVNAVGAVSSFFSPPPLFSSSTSSTGAQAISDAEFIQRLPAICDKFPVLVNLVHGTWNQVVEYFSEALTKTINKLAHKIEQIQIEDCKKQLDIQRATALKAVREESRRNFLSSTKERFVRDPERCVTVQNVTEHAHKGYGYYSSQSSSQFTLVGESNSRIDACLKYYIRVLQLTEDDKHRLQLESTHVPKPKLSHTPYTFTLPVDERVILCQLLDRDRCLLITSNPRGDMRVFLDRLVNIDQAVTDPNGSLKKRLVAERIGGKSIVAFDESRRLLTICAVEKPMLHFFVFDETFSVLQGYSAPVDLRSWYDSQTVIKHAALRPGTSDELLLVDESLQARIFSLATRSFRPAFVQLATMPHSLLSSPDGSCVFSVDYHTTGVVVQAYHWGTFGTTSGICLELPDIPHDSWAITSLIKRSKSHCHFLALESSGFMLKSILLSITHKATEFTFQADRQTNNTASRPTSSTYTSLLTCHRDVWTRFPVVPAVHRHTFKTSTRKPRSLTFVSHVIGDRYQRTFNAMIERFETSTRKPTGGELSSIEIHAITYSDLMTRAFQNVSRFKAGEWLVDILCLIPIHLAVARDNRFVPLKDGVWSLELERSLLGATVEQVIDTLSFGWYESIFQSYMSTKPVKVVSSMGEQSVGKSFTMNHLVDTSFAGSAMRTTEGVWMAVTPTDDMLIVALDFEGVHSIERTAQEDSLLVLFNTAISNLVLFRNNFALSRDITGLFQSFQSSSTVLDPATNPSLFQSTLVIIIKDVVESDKDDITVEFSTKFQDIVQTEQEANFISRLHRGSLTIIPWPVIGSQEFYTMFSDVEALLHDQAISHPQASTFLQKMKTLMAKLKTNDWGSIDENLASHRAKQLQSILPVALTIGATELEPIRESLKDLDTGRDYIVEDSDAKFFLPHANGPTGAAVWAADLDALRISWSEYHSRFDTAESFDTTWAERLDQYLGALAESRIEYVRKWLDINTARFSAYPTSFTALRHHFDNLSIALKAHVKLCLMQCADCHLVCIQPRHHDGSHSCNTSHQCHRECAFSAEHGPQTVLCGMSAGHPGDHVCDVSVHLCGQPCKLSGKGGCLERCSKLVGHVEEHLCQARGHECGMPCSLNGARLYGGGSYSCPEPCCISSEEDHTEHRCKQRSCPIKCQLCKRFCSDGDHLHGISEQSSHLCGGEHNCMALCQSDGICKIETAPQSISATFTGRHETFQYTKYTQVAKRLPCAIPVPAGLLQHHGKHSHELSSNVFHFCKESCKNCGYFCTLPLGHVQAEHETSHGSMSKTLWTVEGQDGTVIEVNGRKFASNDTGAPMLCSMVCRSLGRHAHIDICLSEESATCGGAGLQHIHQRMSPDPSLAKDWISHELHWRRIGFKDPYPQEDRSEFSKCDAMCTGQEHQADTNGRAQPSYCNSPIFHPPHALHSPPPNGTGYISGDGHHFSCRNPTLLQRAFHVVFVVDRSGSMSGGDRRPLDGTPVTATLRQRHNNRIGAVYSSLFTFWQARHSAITAGATRRDAYSVLLFDHALYNAVTNDFTSTPEALLNSLIPYGAGGGTEFNMALQGAQRCIDDHWSTERAPVVIFLSDGECSVSDAVVRDLCQRSVTRGMPLSFHSVAFGPSNQNLRRMAQIATDVQNSVRADPMNPVVPSSYTEAIDSIRLAETFLGIAASLTKPRGALMRTR